MLFFVFGITLLNKNDTKEEKNYPNAKKHIRNRLHINEFQVPTIQQRLFPKEDNIIECSLDESISITGDICKCGDIEHDQCKVLRITGNGEQNIYLEGTANQNKLIYLNNINLLGSIVIKNIILISF